MTVVIRLGIIKVTAENIKFMRTTYPEKVIDFLLQDGGDAFVDLIENSSMSVEKAELVGLLEDKRTERSAAVRLIDSYNGPISIADKKYPEAIQVKIIEDSYDVKDTNWLLNHYDQQTTTVQEAFIRHVQTHPDELTKAVEAEKVIPVPVYAQVLSVIRLEEAEKIRKWLPNKDFEDVCTGNRRPTFNGDQNTKAILEYFRIHEWISSYKQMPSGEFRVYPKLRQESVAIIC